MEFCPKTTELFRNAIAFSPMTTALSAPTFFLRVSSYLPPTLAPLPMTMEAVPNALVFVPMAMVSSPFTLTPLPIPMPRLEPVATLAPVPNATAFSAFVVE